jgi:predicted dehydrogenase
MDELPFSKIDHLFVDEGPAPLSTQGDSRAVASTAARSSVPKSAQVGVGVIGYGYWGPNLVRNFAEAPGSCVVGVSDLNRARLAKVEARYASIKTTTDYRDLFADPAIEAIAISTPVASHFRLAMEALQSGKHVLVEKPLATNVEQAYRLIEEAERRERVLMVDHTFVYTGAVQKMKDLIGTGQLGSLRYYDSVRVNLGLFQHDVDVLWDLAVHDLAIMDFVLAKQPYAVAATGVAHVPGKPINIGYLTCFFEDNLLAHINANWLAPVKIRRTLIGGDRQMVVYDDLEPSEKIKVYYRGITLTDGDSTQEGIYELMVSYRTGDMWAPKVSLTEALSIEARHFLECILHTRRPISDGLAGVRVVKILEAATKSLSQGGTPVELTRREVLA